mmetsp:Transcript_12849/g.30349  ORF Transcript_12849/g.30349 Transcript_12849/m.30349 type:complete len:98 (+) Transcript_12849:209-502(+)
MFDLPSRNPHRHDNLLTRSHDLGHVPTSALQHTPVATGDAGRRDSAAADIDHLEMDPRLLDGFSGDDGHLSDAHGTGRVHGAGDDAEGRDRARWGAS